MDLTGVRSEPHVAQQSRREKLRVQQINTTQSRRTDYLHHHSDEQQIPLHAECSADLVQVRSVRNANSLFDQSFLPSEMTCFSSDFNALSSQRDSIVRPPDSENPLLHSSSHSISCNLNLSSKVHQQASDWILNCENNPWSAENNQNPTFSGEVANGSVPQPYLRPSYSHDYSFSNDNLPEQDRRKNAGESQFITLPFQNNLLDVVSPASIQTPVSESGQAGWSSATELDSFPSFRNQGDLFRFENSMNWVHRSAENSAQQGLYLSLSANPPFKSPASQLEDGRGSEYLQQTNGIFRDHNYSVSGKSGCLGSISKPSAISKDCGKSIPEIIGVSSNTCRNTGPLGPFTGYAIILKSSKFLKPAQQLLDEICGKSKLSSGKTCDVSETASVDVFDTNETGPLAKGYNLSASSSTFYGSSESIRVNDRSSVSQSFRPDVQQKKAKLVDIMEEVCRRYRQYNQQMQMVVSSFESVAGLGSATPFISTALKTVLRQFRCLKDVISDQLRHMRQRLGEELLSQVTETSGGKGGGSCAKVRGDEQRSGKYGYGVGGFGLFQPNQHLWRPQRGLPERAVGVLRAWLFEHFLHPYPTDADKHMLATQTGLSRNQVSNWFINARVRVWKPMVEEIHLLETKASTDANPNQTENPKNSKESCSNLQEGDHQKQPGLDEDPGMGPKEGTSENQWWSGHDKRSRVESEASPSSFEGPLVGFMPYRRSQLGGVSLTLGLRHGVENSQQQMVLEHQNQLSRRRCGEQYVRDFVG